LTDDLGPGGSDGELLPGDPDFERTIAQGEYIFAKMRFIRSFETDGLTRFWEQATKQRIRLRQEVDNLRLVTRARHETAIEHARAYGSILPPAVRPGFSRPRLLNPASTMS
jgi:hypothetical protein